MSQSTPEPKPLPAHLRGAEEGMGASQLDALFADIAAETVEREPSIRDRARELPTPVRTATAVAAAVGLILAYTVAVGIRSDLDTLGWTQFGAMALALTAVSVLAASITLRGLHDTPLHATSWRIGVAAVLLPVLVSVVPGLIPGIILADPPMHAHISCGVGGLVAGTVSALAMLFFSREDQIGPWRILAVSGAGGLLGYVAQGAHCAMVNPGHLLFAHGLYGVVIWALLSLAMAARQPRA